jgi:hypothetical protein
MTTTKAQETKVILLGGGSNIQERKSAEVMIVGQAIVRNAAGTIQGATNAVAWGGGITLPKEERGQGYSGVYATDIAAANLYASGAEVRYTVVGKDVDFHGWLKASGSDITAGDELEIISEGTYKGCFQKKDSGVAVAQALESIAISGISVNTPIQLRRL